jgi:hydroxymethylpyrimidine pyrophosphatase-like HAD family hydrolase
MGAAGWELGANKPTVANVGEFNSGLIRLNVIALDYDGTISFNDALDPTVRTAVHTIRRRGICVILVTGRRLSDLRRLLGNLDLFDAVVSENGAVAAYPALGRSVVLGPPPPPELLTELHRRQIPFESGDCVVEAGATEASRILAILRDLELPLAIVFNRNRLMVLPQGITKATGLDEVLSSLRLSAHNALAIGDAENDHELLAACEVGAAVAWGSAALKRSADLVVEGLGPANVARFIRNMAEQRRLPATGRRRLQLGTQPDGRPFSLAIRGRSILISGDPNSGKSWITGLICEQLILQRYAIFVIDPEGDYRSLEALPGVLVFGEEKYPPPLTELTRILHHHDVSMVADLSCLPHHEKVRYVRMLLHLLAAHRRQTGLPHRIVVDEAHYFLHDADVLDLLDLHLSGYILVTYRASQLHPQILAASEGIIVSRETDSQELKTLHALHRLELSEADASGVLSGLAMDEAVLLPGIDEARGKLCKFKVAPRLSAHVRHRHKYFDVPVPPERAFRFTHQTALLSARTLREFIDALGILTSNALQGYLRRNDFSRWIDEVFGDYVLAQQIAAVENAPQGKGDSQIRTAIIDLIEKRYALGNPGKG